MYRYKVYSEDSQKPSELEVLIFFIGFSFFNALENINRNLYTNIK